jgi:hypothetical protein
MKGLATVASKLILYPSLHFDEVTHHNQEVQQRNLAGYPTRSRKARVCLTDVRHFYLLRYWNFEQHLGERQGFNTAIVLDASLLIKDGKNKWKWGGYRDETRRVVFDENRRVQMSYVVYRTTRESSSRW